MRQRLGSSVSDVVRSLDRESPLGPFARAENPDVHRDSAQHAQAATWVAGPPALGRVQIGHLPDSLVYRLPVYIEGVDQDQAIDEG